MALVGRVAFAGSELAREFARAYRAQRYEPIEARYGPKRRLLGLYEKRVQRRWRPRRRGRFGVDRIGMALSKRRCTMLRMSEFAATAACCIGLSLLAGPGLANERVQPFSGQYEGRKTIALIPATATADIALRRSARFIVYTMRSTVKWAFLERQFRECSVIRIDGDKLLPLEYEHVDESQPEHDVHTRFDWNENKAITRLGAAPKAVVAEIAWPTWDPMSFQVALIALAQQRRPGDSETQRVIERGVVKAYQVRFAGAVPVAGARQSVQAHEIVAKKEKGQVALYLEPQHAWRPLRIVIDDVTVDLAAGARADPPASLVEGQVPQCSVVNAR